MIANILLKFDISNYPELYSEYITQKQLTFNIVGAGGDQHVIEGEMLNLPEPSIDAPCPPDYSSYDEIASDFTAGNILKIMKKWILLNTKLNPHPRTEAAPNAQPRILTADFF